MTTSTWTYNGHNITNISDLPDNIVGFVYLITDANGKKYIGQKQIFSIRKRKFGKKEAALVTDKRKKLYEMVKKESAWQSYTGSNKDLNAAIKSGIKYTKKILHIVYHKKQLNYWENYELFSRGVLLDEDYYNDNIQGRFFRKDLVEL